MLELIRTLNCDSRGRRRRVCVHGLFPRCDPTSPHRNQWWSRATVEGLARRQRRSSASKESDRNCHQIRPGRLP